MEIYAGYKILEYVFTFNDCYACRLKSGYWFWNDNGTSGSEKDHHLLIWDMQNIVKLCNAFITTDLTFKILMTWSWFFYQICSLRGCTTAYRACTFLNTYNNKFSQHVSTSIKVYYTHSFYSVRSFNGNVRPGLDIHLYGDIIGTMWFQSSLHTFVHCSIHAQPELLWIAQAADPGHKRKLSGL